jgi:NADPH:quinone reductase-like Zn-dependent oxidoreductase
LAMLFGLVSLPFLLYSTKEQPLTYETATYYKDRRAGCFQEIVVVPQHTVFPVPESIDLASAASLGVGGLTAAMTLWHWLGIPLDAKPQDATTSTQVKQKSKEVLLVWGGSTVIGQFAIQIAAQAGLEVIAVCSSSTAEIVSSLGATHVVTYNEKTDNEKTDFHIIGEILCLAQGRLTKAIDIVGHKTARQVLKIIAACGRPVDFAPLAFISTQDAIPPNATVHTVEMKRFILDTKSERYAIALNEMVANKSVKIPKIRLLEGGLGAIEDGLLTLKNGTLAGEKLIVAIA